MSDTKWFGQKRACSTLIIIVTHHCNEKKIACAVAIRGYKTTQTNRNNRNMSKSKGWTLQSSLLTLWMEKTRVNNQTKIDDDVNLLKTL